MTEAGQPAWLGLFPDQDFEFRFGVRPGDADAFFARTSEHKALMVGRRQALNEARAHHLFEESLAEAAIVECLAWVGIESGG